MIQLTPKEPNLNTQLLTILADGEWHSGQTLANAAGISRVAIWKQLQKLQDLGIEIEGVKNRGYRIEGGLDLLRRSAIETAIGSAAQPDIAELHVETQIDSTNRLCLERISQSLKGAVVVTTEQQTAGRGRRGKAWVSPFARNIYLSIGWQMQGGASQLQGLSLAAGVAVNRALATLGLANLSLKWPNDLLVDGQKLGGILIELTGDAAGPCQVVIGLGLNVNMPAVAQAQIDQPYTDLAAQGITVTRSALLGVLINELILLLREWEQTGFAAWRSAWQALDAYQNQPVKIFLGDTIIAGVARGVDEQGAILIETATGISAFHGGEISLRPQG